MLKKFGFGRDARPGKEDDAPASDLAAPQQQLAKHREMVRVAVKGTLKEHGLGASWVGCDVNFALPLLAGRALPEALAIRLIVQEWREDLLRYLPVLQRKILAALDRNEPGIDHSRHMVSWQFAPDCGCKVDELPAASSWSSKAEARPESNTRTAGTTGTTGTSAKRAFDLPLSERDLLQDDHDDIPSTFAATQAGFLQSTPGVLPKLRK